MRITALIFAKYPEPGRVNTRMVPPLSREEAAGLHATSLVAVCERVGALPTLETKLVVTPDDLATELRDLVGDNVGDCWPQGGGDLGRRLTRATDRAFSAGADGVLLLGADSPTLPASFLNSAIACLREHEAVMGPCHDGGYYLLGLRQPLPALFERIDWGGEHVASQTRDRASVGGVDLCELPTWYDLDRLDDLRQVARDLANAAAPAGGSATHALRVLTDALLKKYSVTSPPSGPHSAGQPLRKGEPDGRSHQS